ncbi:hypothetical protein Q3G72_028675 [Acer saccharum]|nr:hypothetical protein Q3G72_028675 [Acer saccharum]
MEIRTSMEIRISKSRSSRAGSSVRGAGELLDRVNSQHFQSEGRVWSMGACSSLPHCTIAELGVRPACRAVPCRAQPNTRPENSEELLQIASSVASVIK